MDGPVEKPELIFNKTTGNCRFAVQDFYYKYFGKFLLPEQILLPEAYKHIGRFIFQEQEVDFDKLKVGDIVYAKKIFNKNGNNILKTKQDYKDEDEWILYSHSAIFLGKATDKIKTLFSEYDLPEDKELVWHATSYEGKSCVWTVEKFVEKYHIIAVKRLIK